MAARVRLPNFSSLPSKRSNSVNASAVPPAKPPSTLPLPRGRTLRALPFMTVLPRVTWPSPPMATAPLRRTARIVVPCGLKTSDMESLTFEDLRLAFSPRVGSVVGAGQVGEIKMRVDLRGRDVGVAEQLLDSAQILTRFKQMGGEGVAEQVGIYARRQPLAARPSRDAQLDRALLQSGAIAPDEQRLLADRRETATFLEPRADRFDRLASDGHDARLRALAEHTHRAIREIDAAQVRADQLGKAQPRRIKEFHDRAVAHRERVGGRDVEQVAQGVDVECARQA